MKTTRQIMEEIESLAKRRGDATRRHFIELAVSLGGDEEKVRQIGTNCNMAAGVLYLVCLPAERDSA